MSTDRYDGDDWDLLDHLLAMIHGASYARDEVLQALTACLAKTIVQAGDDEAHVMRMVDASNRLLHTSVDFQIKSGREYPSTR
jgi:hypothetical protein